MTRFSVSSAISNVPKREKCPLLENDVSTTFWRSRLLERSGAGALEAGDDLTKGDNL
jgi:hypothetical protein